MSEALAPYPTLDALHRSIHDLAAAAGGEVVEYGQSVEGRPLLAVRVPGARPGMPQVSVCANIHGPEFIGSFTAMQILAQLGQNGETSAVRERAEVWVMPCLNPDAYARVWERGGRGTMVELRVNANGVDLNRNFPLPEGATRSSLPGAGSDSPGDATYRGSEPLSEPETRGLVALLEGQRIRASTNLHSVMGVLIPPRVATREAFRTYKALCRVFRRAQPRSGYPRLASHTFDVYTGEQEDFQHAALGTWALCVEHFPLAASIAQHVSAPTLFWRFNPREPKRWSDNDIPGIVAYWNAVLDRVETPR